MRGRSAWLDLKYSHGSGTRGGIAWYSTRTIVLGIFLTLVGFAVSNIDRDGAQQLELSFDAAPDRLAIDSAVDEVRRRFGNASVMRGLLLGRDQGLEMPMLPD